MRPIRILLVALAVAGLVAGAIAGPAMANPSSNHRPAHASGGKAADENVTAYRAELKAARQAALDAFHENRTAAIREYNATLHAIRASYLENKTKVIDGCRNATAVGHPKPANMSNASKEEKLAFAHCVKDGLAPLKLSARENMTEARESFQEKMREARQAALEGFKASKAHAAAKHRPGGAGRP